jgi:hypothetical protein
MKKYEHDVVVGLGPTSVLLRPSYPCCSHRKVRLEAVASIPRQRYERICPEHGFTWTIERSTVVEQAGACRIDRLDWTAAQ